MPTLSDISASVNPSRAQPCRRTSPRGAVHFSYFAIVAPLSQILCGVFGVSVFISLNSMPFGSCYLFALIHARAYFVDFAKWYLGHGKAFAVSFVNKINIAELVPF